MNPIYERIKLLLINNIAQKQSNEFQNIFNKKKKYALKFTIDENSHI